MGEIPRKADGRRIFSVEFKQAAVGRVTSGEKTMAELSRELEVQPSVLRNWMRLAGC
jgi:transposase-like protein